MARTKAQQALQQALKGKTKKPLKHHNVPTYVDGIWFPSGAEARRYQELKLLQEARKITHLSRQIGFELTAISRETGERSKVSIYRCDFYYWDLTDRCWKVEDVKGVITEAYRIKRAHMKAEYGIDIIEIHKGRVAHAPRRRRKSQPVA